MIQNDLIQSIITNSISDLNTAMTHVGIATGTSTPAESDTALTGEVDRNAKYSSQESALSFKIQVRYDTTEGNGSTFASIGSFNASSSGTMYSENLVSLFNKTASKNAYYILVFKFNSSQS